jgi:hypothetical protein
VVLGFDVEYLAESKRAAVSIWQPRIVTDFEERGGETSILEISHDQEADVTPSHRPGSF